MAVFLGEYRLYERIRFINLTVMASGFINMCFFLTVIVGRSKLAWDFAITIHAINFIVVFLYTRKFPSFSWFFLQILSSLILIFLGTWTTRWRELRDTFFEGLVDPNEGEVGLVTPSQQHSNHSELEQSPIQLKDLESQI